jgi:hypothetical protein
MDITKKSFQNSISTNNNDKRYININGKNIMLNKRIRSKTLREFTEEFF